MTPLQQTPPGSTPSAALLPAHHRVRGPGRSRDRSSWSFSGTMPGLVGAGTQEIIRKPEAGVHTDLLGPVAVELLVSGGILVLRVCSSAS
ncbi:MULTISPECIES: hypothetical protein [unclassified Cryobacterium]|uniref:hypothetical protein n=1 Tax=unclassified Cryobacterium TaxID=2649013 RepID=UPI0018C9BEB2|nr:hypothetical protein [Cryobacterium sp. CAN_C3]